MRLLRRSPLFTCAVTASLALGLGANTVIFNLLDQILLRPLPVKDPGQLVLLDAPGPNSGMFNGDRSCRLFSYPEYRSLRDRGRIFDGLIARFPVGVNFSYEGPAEAAAGELVSGNFFDVLGVRPALGRLLSPQDDLIKGAHPVTVMSYGFWMRRFGGDPGVLGKTVRVNSTPMTVIGVLPRGFFGVYIGRAPDLYVPMMMKAQMTPTWDALEDRTAHWLHILGRVQNRAAAEAAVQALYRPELEADLTAMGRWALARFPAALPGKETASAARILRSAYLPRRGGRAALAVDGHGGPGAADRLRKRSEPDDGLSARTGQGSGLAARDGRPPLGRGAAASGGEPGAFPPGCYCLE